MEIYGAYGKYLPEIKNEIMHKISELSHQIEKRDEEKLYEHLSGRVKQEESMIEKCQRKGLDLTPRSALNDCKDAIGIRVVCNFIDDIYKLVGLLKKQDWCDVIEGIDSEKMRTMVHQAGVKMQQGFLWKSQFIFLY
ncbi:MAG: hypothetical protein ABF778_02625 [Liquorilactobacillus hordei]|uniref:hypothetical protein n=1 Tax=Liquorilactobacillus hordei TaxID=468911 RepID=UPI0039ED3EE6